ncbi:MAG: DNA mismatch repair endonuclease MutL [Chloroflexi bacterium]|nr:DNA mismatch repair endonuclease MutL [Chloroflexota bacterium]
MPIRLLAPDIAAKIAAGEVIERPASVVKELVENSLDAGATDITVEITNGGMDTIRVTDNGSGIAEDEVELAFHRFATSKVSSVSDLDAINTLGFRGEALASIAAVADVDLTTRTVDASGGTRVSVRNGEVQDKEPYAAAPGTTFSVKKLFHDFPVRLKFLKTPAAESSRVETVMSRFALAYPEVRVRLAADGKERLTTSGSGRLKEAFAEVYSAEIAGQMLELEPNQSRPGGPQCTGLVGTPAATRANRAYITFFVNRRWVQSRVLGVALEQAYHGFLKERRYPIAVVNVIVPPEHLDVNVHPAKSEVRFRYESAAFSAVQQAVRSALNVSSPVHEVTLPSSGIPVQTQTIERTETFWPTKLPPPHAETIRQDTQPIAEHQQRPVQSVQTQSVQTPRDTLPSLRVLGQVQNTYVVAEGPQGMYLVDQHAAHERVLFERVIAQGKTRTAEVQALLEPLVLELDPRRYELLSQHVDVLTGMGFLLEEFGANAFLVRGVPGVMGGEDPKSGLTDVLDLMADGGGFESWEERAAYSIACHSAIRAGKILSHSEMEELARQLAACEQPHTCPHGRPPMVHLSASHLEREFGRR